MKFFKREKHRQMGMVAVVTGASGGIGSATVRAFLTAGFDVVGWDIEQPPNDLASHPAFTFAITDVNDNESVRDAARQVRNLRSVVSLAGRALPSEATSDSAGTMLGVADFLDSVQLNLVSHYRVVSALLPMFDGKTVDPSVTFVSSVSGLAAFGLPAYSAAKAGLLSLSNNLAVLLGTRGIRVNAVAPGTVLTSASRTEWAHEPNHFDAMLRSSPLNRLTTEEEVGNAVFLLATQLTGVSGHTLVVDKGQYHGGRPLRHP